MLYTYNVVRRFNGLYNVAEGLIFKPSDSQEIMIHLLVCQVHCPSLCYEYYPHSGYQA